MLKKYTVFLLLVCCTCLQAPLKDEAFIIFDVGQGNCNLVLTQSAPMPDGNTKKVGFLFDGGSCSRQKHPKFHDLLQKGFFAFLKKEAGVAEESSKNIGSLAATALPATVTAEQTSIPFLTADTGSGTESSSEGESPRHPNKRARTEPDDTQIASETNTDKPDTFAKPIVPAMPGIVATSPQQTPSIPFAQTSPGGKPDASTPDSAKASDSEHSDTSGTQASNVASTQVPAVEDAMREALKGLDFLFLFLSHPDKDHINFINAKAIPGTLPMLAYCGGNFLGGAERTTVKKVVAFLASRSRDNTWVEFPFYWRWKILSEPLLSYHALKRLFLNPDKLEDTWKTHQSLINAVALSDHNPEAFFQGTLQALLQETMCYSPGFGDFIQQHIPPMPKGTAYIWGMNHRTADVNGQSTVVSFKLPENKMVLTCTGDAEEATFGRIHLELTLRERQRQTATFFKRCEHTLMVPHHGSDSNLSDAMLKLFKPTVFIISAGNGKQYLHPSVTTWDFLKKHAPPSAGWKAGKNKPQLLVFDKQEDKKMMATLHHSVAEGRAPILGTNVLGTILYQQGLFHSYFNAIFEINGAIYEVNFSKSLAGLQHQYLQSLAEHEAIYSKDGTYYFQVIRSKQPVYYPLNPIDEQEAETP